MINRRSLLKGLLATVAAAPMVMLGKEIQVVPGIKDAPDEFQYHGFNIMWTGWKFSQTCIDACGQWVAWNGSNAFYAKSNAFYANSGGAASKFHRGDCFNISNEKKENWIDIFNVDEAGPRVREEALHRLLKMIHEQGF